MDEAIKEFNIKIKKIYRYKGKSIINTVDGKSLILKKTNESTEHLLFSNKIKIKLMENEFTNIDKFYLTKDEKPYLKYNDENYILTDYLNMEHATFEKHDVFLKTVENTAKIHSILERNDFCNCEFYGKSLIDISEKGRQDLEKIKKTIKTFKKTTDFDIMFIKNYDYYYNRINEAIKILENNNYIEKQNEAMKKASICHNLLKKENLYFEKDNIFITNFTYATIDLNLIDLSSLIIRHLKQSSEEKVSIEKILETYGKYHKIDNEDMKNLYAILLYPETFIKICNKLYIKKRTWVPSAIMGKMSAEVEKRQSYERYIKGLY